VRSSDMMRRRRRACGNSYSSRVMSPRIAAMAGCWGGGGVGGVSYGKSRRRTADGLVE
jgi:hypothetical protein